MFKKNFFKLFSLALLIYPLSFINQILISYFFGTSAKLDAYWFSMSLAMVLIIHLQPVKEILVNEFYVLKKSDIIKANQFLVENLFAWIILLVLSSLLFYTFSYEIVYLIMKDFSKEYFDSYLIFFKFMIVYVNFLFISEILSGILITFGIVIYQNLSRLIVVVSSILFLFLFFDFFNEYTLVYSLITGLFFLIIIQLIDLNKNKIIFFFRLPKIKINFLKKISGLIFVALISQLYLLYERMIFSGLSSGLISAYQYSKSLHDIPYFLIVMTIQTSLWPAYLKAVNLGNTDQIYQMTVKKLKLLIIIFLLISVQIYFFSDYILYLLFYRGAFGIDSLNLTSITLKVVIIGLLPLSILTLLGRALYAFKAIKWISLSGIFGTIVGLMFLHLGHYKQNIEWALYHFPASQICILFITGSGFLYYTKKIQSYKFWKSLILWFLKISFVFSIIISLYPFPDFDFKDRWELFFEILIHATSSSSLIFIMIFCFGIINFKQSIKKFKSIKFIHFN